jgi:hypothetical protein
MRAMGSREALVCPRAPGASTATGIRQKMIVKMLSCIDPPSA